MTNKMIPVELLKIATSYQRTVKKSRVKSIVKKFDRDAVGSLCVGERSDGTYWVVDGQQRLTAMIELGFKEVSCDVFESRGASHEAKVFRNKNKDRTGITSFTIFNALLVEGDEMAVSVQAAAESCGFTISESKRTWPALRCVNSLQQAYDIGGVNLVRDVLEVISDAWIGEDDALHGTLVSGIALLLGKYPDVDKRRLVRVLKSKNPSAVSRAADGYKLGSGTRPKAVCRAILDIYNKGLKKGRLACGD